MLKALLDAMERPGRVLLVLLALGGGFVIADAIHASIVGDVSVWEAFLDPSEESAFARIAALVLVAFVAITIEVTLSRYRQTARELRAERERLKTLYEKNPAAVITLDRDLTVSYANEKVANVVGTGLEKIVGYTCHEAITGDEVPCEGCMVEKVFETGQPQSRIKHETTTAGRENWLSQVWYPLFSAEGHIESVVEIASDVSGLKLDPLTSLPNRILLRDRLDVAMASARRHGQEVAVLFMDIDEFKSINDTLGHAAGDAVLTGLAERMRGIVRQDETFARYGGDEFVLLLPAVESAEQLVAIAERISGHLESPFVVEGRDLRISTSIGIAVFAGDSETASDLIDRADAAMYAAKSSGGGTYEFAPAAASATEGTG
jgi:diguanylate cyclase (GGDEF)-like protein/PAS domain S-box-containing protein